MRSRISKTPPAVIAARNRRDARRLAAEVIRRKSGCARSSKPELSSQPAPLRSIRLSDAIGDEIDSTVGAEVYLTSSVMKVDGLSTGEGPSPLGRLDWGRS